MRRLRRFMTVLSLFICLQLAISDTYSGDHEALLSNPHHRSKRLPSPVHHPHRDSNLQRDKAPDSSRHHHATSANKLVPAAPFLSPRFRQVPVGHGALNLLAKPEHGPAGPALNLLAKPEHGPAGPALNLLAKPEHGPAGPALNLLVKPEHGPAGPALNLLVKPEHGPAGPALNLLVKPEHGPAGPATRYPVSARHLVTVYLAVDVRRLNVSLLRWFREGVAAALGVPPRHVHINRLNERKNGIELFVASDRPGNTEPRPAEDVIQSLNIRVLHRSLGHFGITEVSTEENALQGQQRDQVWNQEGFYAIVLFLTIFVIVVTCLMVLYRLKEKVNYSDRPVKALPPGLHLTSAISPDHAQRSKGIKVTTSGSMVQAERPPAKATPIPQEKRIIACRLAPPSVPSPSPVPPAPVPKHCDPAPQNTAAPPPVTSHHELKPCPSPFRMKPAAGLQERRGSNVSLVLDMSALGSVEPLSVAVVTPRESAAREYLLAAGRPITRQQLRDLVDNTHTLHAEFAEIPMNFVDPKELDIPSHGTKNRYKTILPNPHSRVVLKWKCSNDPLSSYINANYIRGYRGEERAYIATQGPMVNTVNDLWHMAWQEECPVIVMITKLKEKNEKCVLYWPERRGIYGKVEVLVNSVRECEHYTTRSLTLKCGNQSRSLQHYWYTSWPDHKTPDSAQPLLQLMTDVEGSRRAAAAMGPVVVHCSAGIGRTGCFIATTIGCRQLQLEGVVDVLGIVCQMRADRGGMIQTGEQYEFVHHAMSLYEARLSAETGQ